MLHWTAPLRLPCAAGVQGRRGAAAAVPLLLAAGLSGDARRCAPGVAAGRGRAQTGTRLTGASGFYAPLFAFREASLFAPAS
jgi:hypothetical protein